MTSNASPQTISASNLTKGDRMSTGGRRIGVVDSEVVPYRKGRVRFTVEGTPWDIPADWAVEVWR